MKVLIVKTSSLGDVIHTLPALSDARQALPDLRFDWVVEEAFAEIPAWHPAVDTVIPVALRRWRKHPVQTVFGKEWSDFRRSLRACRYDKVIDAQGLMKSAMLAVLARGPRCGLSNTSAKEPLSAVFYHKKYRIPKGQHAIERIRQLFSAALDYPQPATAIDYGIKHDSDLTSARDGKFLVFLHGTSRPDKEWPEPQWIALAKLAYDAGYRICLPWGNATEHRRAQRIAATHESIEVLPRMNLTELAKELSAANGVIAVDTGLAHLAAALSTPCVTLYASTNPDLIGTRGRHQRHLRQVFSAANDQTNPLCESLPAQVWREITELMGSEVQTTSV